MIRTAQKAPKPSRAKHLKRVGTIAAKTEVSRFKPGPKRSGKAKVPISLRVDQDVLAKFRATGPGWQTIMARVITEWAAKL